MASIIPGYNYDIFISYRQKDNKYDGWVTEFVDNLKRELESMFKDEVSVYFDINPSDYLLETYDVDASLKDKLKCLVFIPVISRTYCDPKAFAWTHEFKAFIDQTKGEDLGLKVRLQNGNVATRVLPVRINDLDTDDLKLCETMLGGIFRGVDFIYKEPGVNRPLRSTEENPQNNLYHTTYRNQINKVALAVREIIETLKAQASPDHELLKPPEHKVKDEAKAEAEARAPGVKKEPKPAKEKKQKKVPESEPEKNREVGTVVGISGIPGRNAAKRRLRTLAFVIPGIIVVLGAAGLLINHQLKIKWARELALPEIERLALDLNYAAAFDLILKAEKYIPDDPKLTELDSIFTEKVTLLTDPPGADVFAKEYSDLNGEWKHIGRTPIEAMKIPAFTFYRMRIEKPGYEKVMAVNMIGIDTLKRTLFSEGTVPENMVYVEGYLDEVRYVFMKDSCGFFMDMYEVTNKQFKKFIDEGGYRRPEYWRNEFNKGGRKLSFVEAMDLFVDKTGRPGPSTWEAGDYPDGQDDYPVGGVSWYEAAAYAEYAGKSLPTGDHWDSGAGFNNADFYNFFGSKLYPLSNFKGKGPEPVGKSQGINLYGAYDMAGNVREWCWNETSSGRIFTGGGWSDATYIYANWNQLPPFDRSPENGFRCVKYIDETKIPETAMRAMDLGRMTRDYSSEIPVSEEVFNIYRNQFLYDSIPLDAVREERYESAQDYNVEKITFNAAYGNERMAAFLFLPKNASPPFQTAIFFPGSYAVHEKDLMKNNPYSYYFEDFALKSGRAIMYPVYYGTFERNSGQAPHIPDQSHRYTEELIKLVKDFSRSVDYLETRDDIDTDKLAYIGHSWGGVLGGIIPAVEDRLSLNILILGGFSNGRTLPEADAINYVPRIKIPTLMLNGRYDNIFPLATSPELFFDLLGTPEKDKRLCVYETGHYIPGSDMTREISGWFDKYFGPANYLQKE